MAFSDTLNKIVEPLTKIVSNVALAVAKVYSIVVIAQASRGVADANKSAILAQIEAAKLTIEKSKQTEENTKKFNLIANKIKNEEYITQDEYNFVIENGGQLSFSYSQYLQMITQPKTVNVQTVQTQQVNYVPLIVTTVILGGGAYFIFRRKK